MNTFSKCRRCLYGPNDSRLQRLPECWYVNGDLVGECEKHKAWRVKEFARKTYLNNGFPAYAFDLDLPHDYYGDKSKANVERLAAYVDRFQEEPEIAGCILYLYGMRTTQKTTVASWVAARLIEKKEDVRYCMMKDLMSLMTNEFDDASRDELMQLLECDLLVVDESFDKEKCRVWESGKQMPAVETFFKKRTNSGKGTVFVSNVWPECISQQGFTESIQEFVRREITKYDSALLFQDNYEAALVPKRLF